MKKRTRILCIIVGVLLLLLLTAGIVCARLLRTDYLDAVTEADGVYMEWVEEPSREILSYQVSNTSGNPIYGDFYLLEYMFLGRWYRLIYRAGATRDLDGIVVGEYADVLKLEEKPMQLYAFLPAGKYRLVQRFYTVKDHMLYENRDKYIDLYLEFELD